MSNNDSDDKPLFHIGDRVVLCNLRSAARLNGRHGVVAASFDQNTQRYGVDLDLLDVEHPKGLAVKSDNLLVEPELEANSTKRAGTREMGLLVKEHGRDASFILDSMRYLVGYVLLQDAETNDLRDIDGIKNRDMIKINYLTAMGWTHWLDPGSFETTDVGIYQCLHDYIRNDLVESSYGSVDNIPPGFRRIYDAIVEPAAVAGWNIRIHGDFWVVSWDKDGTYLVPEANPRAVYQAVGLTQPPGALTLQKYGRIVKMRLTMIPWYGRLLCDGVVSPVDSFGELGGPQMASDSQSVRLKEAVRLAKEEGRVVSRLLQLEVPGGSRLGTNGRDPHGGTMAPSTETEAEATEEERCLVQELGVFPHISKGRGAWAFRRHDYTEEENPNHVGLVLRIEETVQESSVIGPFSCSALKPSSVDILSSILKYARKEGRRPREILIDERSCYKRVKAHLLKDMENAQIDFYMPPTKEETNAAILCEQMGTNPFA